MKIVVFDDDPTGSQTVHSCLLILNWSVQLLRKALRNSSPFLFVLANTRSLSANEAVDRNREICIALKQAIQEEGLSPKDILIVSRGDSTLRGHGFIEPKVISDEFGPFDAIFHVPAFIEGGRITVDGIHFLNGMPVHQTDFAKDKIFGYDTSNLAIWLEKKSNGLINRLQICCITFEDLDAAKENDLGFKELENTLKSFSNNQHVIVDAKNYEHIFTFAKAIQKTFHKKKYLFRSAASLINGLGNLMPKILTSKEIDILQSKAKFENSSHGIIVVGSHVPLATLQLEELLKESDCEGIELNVNIVLESFNSDQNVLSSSRYKNNLIDQISCVILKQKTPVLYTSRLEICFDSLNLGIQFKNFIAEFIADIISEFSPNLKYIISKGGITTNTIIKKGLSLEYLFLEGQILPGLSLLSTFENKNFKNKLIATIPGNLGDNNTLVDVLRILKTSRKS